MLLIAGLILIALGLFSGAVLVIAPFGILPLVPGLTLWALFPLLTAGGYLMAIMAAEPPQVRIISRVTSGLLLAYALVSAAGLVLFAATTMVAASGLASLWYVLMIGMLFGAAGMAIRGGSAQ